MVRQAKAVRSLPFLGTIPPTWVEGDDRASPARNAWVAGVNDRIRAMASEEGAVLVDVHEAFLRGNDPRCLFKDGLHPSDAGYDLIAQAFFDGLTRR